MKSKIQKIVELSKILNNFNSTGSINNITFSEGEIVKSKINSEQRDLKIGDDLVVISYNYGNFLKCKKKNSTLEIFVFFEEIDLSSKITTPEDLRSIYKKAKLICEEIENDCSLKSLVDNDQLYLMASRLSNLPNFSIEMCETTLLMLKSELLMIDDKTNS